MFSARRSDRPKTDRRAAQLFRPALEMLEERRLLSVADLRVSGFLSLSSYAGVGFKENQVAYLAASVDGQADPDKGDFQATIHWGDGQSSTGDLVYTGTNGRFADFLVKGSHTYAKPGTQIPITVEVTGAGSSDTGNTAAATVKAMPSGISGKEPPTATGGEADDVDVRVSGFLSVGSYARVGFKENTVAYLAVSVDGEAHPDTSDLHAWINWGDSAAWTKADLVYTGTNGRFADFIVKGSHTYAKAKTNIPIVVYATGPDGTGDSDDTAAATVKAMPSGIAGKEPPTSSAGAADIVDVRVSGFVSVSAYASNAFKGQPVAYLAVSVDGKASKATGSLHAWINWGDSAGWFKGDLVYTGTNGGFADFIVKGSHVYARANTNIPIVVYATGPDGTSDSDHTAAADVQPDPFATPALHGATTRSVTEGQGKGGLLATFVDETASEAARLVAKVVNGDGSHGNGSIKSLGGDRYGVYGSHDYPNPGTYTATITISNTEDRSSTARATVTVVRTYGTDLLGDDWQQKALAAAGQMDKLATDIENHAIEATDQFVGGVADWANETLTFLAQKPGVPAQQLAAGITKYFTNNAYDNNQRMLKAAVQAIDEFKQNPARFFGKNVVNILLTALGTGKLLKEAKALADELKAAERTASTLEKSAAVKLGAGLGPGDFKVKVPKLTPGTNRDMLKQAIQLTAEKQLPASVESGYFASLAKQIIDHSKGGWKYYLLRGADGAYVFSGDLGHSVVISPTGQVFTGIVRGTVADAGAASAGLIPTVIDGKAVLKIDYSLLRLAK